MGEASTAYLVGRRGDRAPRSAGTASKRLVADAEGFNAPEGNTGPSALARRGRSAGVHRPRHAGREMSKNLGSPRGSCSRSVQAWGQEGGKPTGYLWGVFHV